MRASLIVALSLSMVTMTLALPVATATHSCPGGYPTLCVMDGHEDEETWRNRVLTVSEGAGSFGTGWAIATVWVSQYVTDRPDWHYESTSALVSVMGAVSPASAFTHSYAQVDQTTYDRDGETDHTRTQATVSSDHRVEDTRLEAEVTYSQVDEHDGEGCREHLWLETETPTGETEEDLLDARPCTVEIPQLIASGARVPIVNLPA